MTTDTIETSNFLKKILEDDLNSGKHDKIVTRFPPEPNGYLHIGHAKSICINFGMAQAYNGVCNLRFDDTNPEKESQEYIDAIKADVNWLGFNWDGDVRYASDYFDTLYNYALHLIQQGLAYVCHLSPDEAREYRGTLKAPGQDSPYRNRTVEENLDLFEQMRAGKVEEGECVLRAKIDMAAPNINLRDPIIYRVRKVEHHQTKDKWCIYPIYDFTHGQSDALEGITHSICTLEFEDHKPLYEWFLDNLPVPSHPKQYEFARLNLNYTVTSKRKLKQLVDEHHVSGWDDPRMPTLSGMRRRGYTPASVRNFCERIGVTRKDVVIDVSVLEHAVREDLDANAPRAMCVIDPIKVVIESYPEGETLTRDMPKHPQKPEMGERTLYMTREIYIDRADFEEVPPAGWRRLFLGGEIRLRGSYVIKCNEAIKDENGHIIELRCTHDDQTLGKNPEGRKVKGVIHWVDAKNSLPAEVRLYDRLFNDETPDANRDDEKTFLDFINPESLAIKPHARIEKSLESAQVGDTFQFEREGYFVIDPDTTSEKIVVNRTVSLRDSWAKAKK